MSYCHQHGTNNCLECAIERQTVELVAVIKMITLPPPTMWQRLKCKLKGEK